MFEGRFEESLILPLALEKLRHSPGQVSLPADALDKLLVRAADAGLLNYSWAANFLSEMRRPFTVCLISWGNDRVRYTNGRRESPRAALANGPGVVITAS